MTEPKHDSKPPAIEALALLFKKLYPYLEDAAHLLRSEAEASKLVRLHHKLRVARLEVSERLHVLSKVEGELGLTLDALAADLTPVGENLQQSLTLTQLCLEDYAQDLMEHIDVDQALHESWFKRLEHFRRQLVDEANRAEERWTNVDPDLGDEELPSQ